VKNANCGIVLKKTSFPAGQDLEMAHQVVSGMESLSEGIG